MLEAKQLTIKYGLRVAVADISLNLGPGKITAVIGPNGAGKSTLLQALNGHVAPAAGEVLLDGRAIQKWSRRSVARRIAVVAQEAELRFPITVLEFVLGGRFTWATTGVWGWETERDLQVINEVLQEAELSDLSGRLMNELSGGERQRAVLARALATEATFLLLDEPTANLDLSHQATLLALVRSRCDSRNAAALVVTHDINLAAQFADNVLLMNEGRAVHFGTPAEVLQPDLLEQVFAVRVLVDAHPLTGVPRVTPVHEAQRHL
jgi:iron complex transport system ATP-binding protein